MADLDFGTAAEIDVVAENLAWFNRFLQATSPSPFPPVRYFSMGDNAWREASDWPPPAAKAISLYLRSDGKANTAEGIGRLSMQSPKKPEPADQFRADPADPVAVAPASPERGKYAAIWGPVEQGKPGRRPDILTLAPARSMRSPRCVRGSASS